MGWKYGFVIVIAFYSTIFNPSWDFLAFYRGKVWDIKFLMGQSKAKIETCSLCGPLIDLNI